MTSRLRFNGRRSQRWRKLSRWSASRRARNCGRGVFRGGWGPAGDGLSLVAGMLSCRACTSGIGGEAGGFREGCPNGVGGICTSEREGGSEEVVRLEVGGARHWDSLVPVRDENRRVGKEVLAGEDGSHVIPGKRWSA